MAKVTKYANRTPVQEFFQESLGTHEIDPRTERELLELREARHIEETEGFKPSESEKPSSVAGAVGGLVGAAADRVRKATDRITGKDDGAVDVTPKKPAQPDLSVAPFPGDGELAKPEKPVEPPKPAEKPAEPAKKTAEAKPATPPESAHPAAPVEPPKSPKPEPPQHVCPSGPDLSKVEPEKPAQPLKPIKSSATIDIAGFDCDVLMLASLVRDARYVIDSVHDTNTVDPRLVTVAIQAVGADDELAESVLQSAKAKKPPVYLKKTFFFWTDPMTGDPVPNAHLYDTFDQAKNAMGNALNDYLACHCELSKLIGHADWYVDAKGKRIQPVSKGEPKPEPTRFRVSSSLVENGESYLRRLHDTGTIHRDLGDLFKQIVLSDDRYVSAVRTIKDRRDRIRRPKMKVGFWCTDKHAPSETPDEARAEFCRLYALEKGPVFMSRMTHSGGTIPVPKVRYSAYYATEHGNFGELITDKQLEQICFREEGLVK